MPRGRYEFPKSVRERAVERYYAENPESENELLEVHHQVPVWWAKKEQIPSALVRVQANAIAVPRDDHKEIHRNELSDDEYRTLAQAVLGWVRNLI